MIEYYSISNFKSLKEIGLSFGKLNLFLGMNGAGKSSLIQSLLLLRQSMRDQVMLFGLKNQEKTVLKISGDLISLGTGQEILCQDAENEHISQKIYFSNENTLSLEFLCAREQGQTGTIVPGTYEYDGGTQIIEKESLFTSAFSYLSADHLSPQNVYSVSQWNAEALNPLGNDGRNAVPFLAMFGDKVETLEILRKRDAKTKNLTNQVSAWMAEISPQIRLNAVYNPIVNNANLLIDYEGERMKTMNISPVNVGFGIPYSLPLLVALLKVKPGDLLFIENPESHLHPRGQAAMAELIARAAAAGAQIFCETHSDHIVNGLRVAMKKGILHEGDLVLDYFERDDTLNTKVTPIDVDAKGSLSEYPSGLLDEWGYLMSELIL